MELLRLSIRQTSGRIGIESSPGQLRMQSASGQLDISSPPADMQIRQPSGELQVDSSAAWTALALGSPFETGNMLTDQANERTMEAIARIAEKGDRMAQITNKTDAVAELASQALVDDPEGPRVAGEASYMNVKLNYIAHPAPIDTTPQHANIQYTPSKLDFNYNPGSVQIYVDQKNSIRMWVSNYDLYT